VDEAPYPFRVKGKGHLPLFVFLLPLLLVLDPFFMEPCPLCNLDPLFTEPCPKLFSLPFNSCPSQHPWHCESFFDNGAFILKCIGLLNVLDYNNKEGEMVRVEGFVF